MKSALGAATFVLLLAGCGGPSDEGRNMSATEVAEELSNVRINPGLWESSSEVVDVTAPNLPREVQSRMKREPTTSRHCISAEQAASPNANFLATQREDCTYRDFSMRDGRMEGTMTCRNADMPGEATARMEGQYGPDSYDMRMTMELAAAPGATMTIETRATGRRIGDCPEGEAG
jgi:hypothetical protein